MRRAPIVITATVVGAAGVLLFKPLATTGTAAAASAPTGTSTGSAEPSTSAAATPSASASATPSTSASTERSAKGATSGTYTGAAVTTRFGTTQVRVTIAGGKLTAVTTLQMNEDDPRSEQISSDAIPTLREEVLTAQSAAVDTVSGATYTSLAYEASLQAALDKAGFTSADGRKADLTVPAIEGR